MKNRWQEKFDFSFTRIQLRVIAVIVIGLALLTVWLHKGRLSARGCDYPVIPTNVELANDKIDPNTADFASLRRLPLVGDSRAMSIIKYRNANMPPNGILFTSPDDLTKIKGIGQGMTARWKTHLTFPRALKN